MSQTRPTMSLGCSVQASRRVADDGLVRHAFLQVAQFRHNLEGAGPGRAMAGVEQIQGGWHAERGGKGRPETVREPFENGAAARWLRPGGMLVEWVHEIQSGTSSGRMRS